MKKMQLKKSQYTGNSYFSPEFERIKTFNNCFTQLDNSTLRIKLHEGGSIAIYLVPIKESSNSKTFKCHLYGDYVFNVIILNAAFEESEMNTSPNLIKFIDRDPDRFLLEFEIVNIDKPDVVAPADEECQYITV